MEEVRGMAYFTDPAGMRFSTCMPSGGHSIETHNIYQTDTEIAGTFIVVALSSLGNGNVASAFQVHPGVLRCGIATLGTMRNRRSGMPGLFPSRIRRSLWVRTARDDIEYSLKIPTCRTDKNSERPAIIIEFTSRYGYVGLMLLHN